MCSQTHAKNKEWCKVAWFASSYVALIRCFSENQNKTKRNPWTNKNLEIWKCPVVQRSVTRRQNLKEDGLIPEVNFSPMSPKLLLTYPHREEDRELLWHHYIFFEIDAVKSLTQSTKNLCQLEFFTKNLTILFGLIYSELRVPSV